MVDLFIIIFSPNYTFYFTLLYFIIFIQNNIAEIFPREQQIYPSHKLQRDFILIVQ